MRLLNMVHDGDNSCLGGFPNEISRHELNNANYKQALKSDILVDHKPAVLTRLERIDGVNNDLFGEHISTVVRTDGTWLGYVDVNTLDAKDTLPSNEHAQEIAFDLLTQIAPDLLSNRDVLWTKPHSETMRITEPASGQVKGVEITGIKVKSRNLNDGLYHWVIIGANGQVIAFERDIKWIKFPGKRATEKWLHDAWLYKHQSSFSFSLK